MSEYRLRENVNQVYRAKGDSLLVCTETDTAIRVSPLAMDLVPHLKRGATFSELADALKEKHPSSRDLEPKLTAFLEVLKRQGLFADMGTVKRVRRFAMLRFNIDPFARALAGSLMSIPPALRYALAAIFAVLAIAGPALLIRNGQFRALSLIGPALDWRGVLAFVFLVVPLHELGHAVTCRAAGVAVSGAGVFLRYRFLPGPFVDTSKMYSLPARRARVLIPAAGPLVDFLCFSACAWIVLFSTASLRHVAAFTACASLVMFISDLNPFRPTDGSHMIEAALNDERARVSAFQRSRNSLRRRTVKIYRWVCAAYFLAALLVIAYVVNRILGVFPL